MLFLGPSRDSSAPNLMPTECVSSMLLMSTWISSSLLRHGFNITAPTQSILTLVHHAGTDLIAALPCQVLRHPRAKSWPFLPSTPPLLQASRRFGVFPTFYIENRNRFRSLGALMSRVIACGACTGQFGRTDGGGCVNATRGHCGALSGQRLPASFASSRTAQT